MKSHGFDTQTTAKLCARIASGQNNRHGLCQRVMPAKNCLRDVKFAVDGNFHEHSSHNAPLRLQTCGMA
jgi:hypothetical protein